MGFNPKRIDDMLRCYGDKEVKQEEAAAERLCRTLGTYQRRAARQRGECRAWVVYDSFFVWKKPLSNTFDQMRMYATSSDFSTVPLGIHTWEDLKDYTTDRAVSFLDRQPMNYPSLLGDDGTQHWWRLMAIIHECDRQLGESWQEIGGDDEVHDSDRGGGYVDDDVFCACTG